MNEIWNMHAAIGEMLGSFSLTFVILITGLVVKINEKNFKNALTKRLFTAIPLGGGIVSAILLSIGFGGHGQINPAVTLMVGIIRQEYTSIPYIIGFQLIGALIAAIWLITMAKLWGKTEEVKANFGFSNQSIKKHVGMELTANIFWLLPIAALYSLLTNGGINVFELALGAALGFMAIVGAVEEIGGGNLNPAVWFGAFLVKMYAQKGKITGKQLTAELSGLASVMAIAAATGALLYGVDPFGKWR